MLEEDILLGEYCDSPGKSFSKPSLRKLEMERIGTLFMEE